MKDIHLRFAESSDESAIIKLLSDASLPIEDLATNLHNFFVAEKDHEIIGTVGIEILGEEGLLRSLAVNPNDKNKGYGSRLVNKMIGFALSKKVKRIFLLTSSAAGFFKKIGFVEINRRLAPEIVKNTKEFKMKFPPEEVCMYKNIG